MERRYGYRVPPRRAEAFFRSVPENRRAESRNAAGIHLQHRRESLGSLKELAAGLRAGLCRSAEAALSKGQLWIGIRQADRYGGRCRFLCVRSRQTSAV